MGDFSAPSFSLGFDIDIADLTTEGENEEEEAHLPSSRLSPDKSMDKEGSLREPSVQEFEEFDVADASYKAQEEDPPTRVLKRLRKGLPPPALPAVDIPGLPVGCVDLINGLHQSENIYDEIEEFSSPEKGHRGCTDDCPSTQSHITCNSTKFSLFHRGLLRDDLDGKQIATKVALASTSASTSTRLEASNVKEPFPRLTVSPIRKINLLDSDSDNSSANKGDHKKNEEAAVSLKGGKLFHEKSSACDGEKNFSASKCQTESFWKDFNSKKNRKIDTPALDEFCKEYFVSPRDQNVSRPTGEAKSSAFYCSRGLDTNDVIDDYDDLDPYKKISRNVCINLDTTSSNPPAYQYFYNTDPRIRALVRQRLPNFIPLGNKNSGEAQQFGDITLDYKSQFNSTYSSGKSHVSEKVSRSNSNKNQNKKRCYNVIETTGCWVNPRSKAAIPKDAGKRRVSADVLQSGQWFTDQDGRKVYASKDGEQLTGRMAYMKYKKETGGFRKPKRKAATNRSRKSKR